MHGGSGQFPKDWRAADLVRLVDQEFDDPEQAITTLEAAIAAEPEIDDWPVAEGRAVVLGRLLLRLNKEYSSRQEGVRADNIEQALATCVRALTILPKDADPALWAEGQHILSYSLFNRMGGNRADNLEQMIAACEAALTIRTRDDFPTEWARTKSNLGTAYAFRIGGERAENLERAITHYEAALTVFTREAFRKD